jgi:hypothetical protein
MEQAANHLGLSGYFESDRILELVHQHRARRSDHGATLWSLLMLDNFLIHHAAQ